MFRSLAKEFLRIRRIIEKSDRLGEAPYRSGSDKPYEDEEKITAAVARGDHRQAIGGLWDEVGKLQRDYLVAQGLQPIHRLLDVGCGSLRGGVHFIRYLNPRNYWGVDLNSSLIEAGWNEELRKAKLQEHQSREQLVC